MTGRTRVIAVAALFVASSLVLSADQPAMRDMAASAPEWGCETASSQMLDASGRENILLAQMSCRDCEVRRDRCHTGCNSLSTSREQLRCVNRCNSSYPCVRGSDCR